VKNRLHVLLPYAYPQYATFFAEPFGKTALAFWELYPSPASMAGICVKNLTEFLQEQSHYFFGRKKVFELIEMAVTGATEREFQTERDQVVWAQVQQCRHLERAIEQVEQQMRRLIKLTGQRLDTLPGVETVATADLLVGIGDVNRFATPDQLAKYAGIAPKQWSSAGKGQRTRSAHGQRILLSTFYRIAVAHVCVNKNGTVRCAQSRAHYEKKLAEGKSKKAALMCLQWLPSLTIIRVPN
jgi:transposase